MKLFNRRHAFLFLTIPLCSALLITPPPLRADEDGRYRAIVLQDGGASQGGGSLTPRVFVIDSRDGHMWTWEKNMPLVGTGNPTFGSVITYQGRVKPGTKIGEIIGQGENPQ